MLPQKYVSRAVQQFERTCANRRGDEAVPPCKGGRPVSVELKVGIAPARGGAPIWAEPVRLCSRCARRVRREREARGFLIEAKPYFARRAHA